MFVVDTLLVNVVTTVATTIISRTTNDGGNTLKPMRKFPIAVDKPESCARDKTCTSLIGWLFEQTLNDDVGDFVSKYMIRH